MKVLHLSDTPLSGSPIRISRTLNTYMAADSRHIVWEDKVGYRIYPTDITGSRTPLKELEYLIYEWAEIICYHNRYRRQNVFKALGKDPPQKPSVIQIHSPRESEDFRDEVASGIPIACVAQYHPRQWPECRYIVPNVVDINEIEYVALRPPKGYGKPRPTVSYAPSNVNMRGWDDKSYAHIAPVLKRMRLSGEIDYQLIHKKPYDEVIHSKAFADIGIDEVSTGSYHLSSLEYLAMDVPCFARIDPLTEKVVKDLTGASELPWIQANIDNFGIRMREVIKEKIWENQKVPARAWMEKYWNPKFICQKYVEMYEDILCQTKKIPT